MNQRRTTTTTRTGPNAALIGGVVAFLVLVAIVTVVVVSGGDDGDGDVETDVATLSEYGAVLTSGELAQLPESGDDPAVGSEAPTLSSEQPGNTVRVDPGAEETPMMLVFLAHWCPHCQAEVPKLVELAEDGAFEGIRTVAVLTSTDDNKPNYPPSAWLDDEGWTDDRFFDDRESSAAGAYGVSSFPFVVYVDADGTVVERVAGGQSLEQLRANAEALRS